MECVVASAQFCASRQPDCCACDYLFLQPVPTRPFPDDSRQIDSSVERARVAVHQLPPVGAPALFSALVQADVTDEAPSAQQDAGRDGVGLFRYSWCC